MCRAISLLDFSAARIRKKGTKCDPSDFGIIVNAVGKKVDKRGE